MKKFAWIIVFGTLCAIWAGLWFFNRTMETALSSPSTLAIFVLYAREAAAYAPEKGYGAAEVPGEVTLRAYNLTEVEIADRIHFAGFLPVIIFRCPMSGFTDASSEGYMMVAYLVPDTAAGGKKLHIGGSSFAIATVPLSDGEHLIVPDLLKRDVSGSQDPSRRYSTPSQAPFRIWNADKGLKTNKPPTVMPTPIFQEDWFTRGEWERTIAFFDDDQTVSEATTREN
ncbi:MAG: hypothetical protein IH945_03350 [Armatimonadetes bacterium]|nr:hypothetical protein [Armatimonadota bacterium]